MSILKEQNLCIKPFWTFKLGDNSNLLALIGIQFIKEIINVFDQLFSGIKIIISRT